MRRPAPRSLALAAVVATVALAAAVVALQLVLLTDSSYAPADSTASTLADLAMTCAFAAVGAVVTWKRPMNLVGWALLLAGDGLLLGGLLSAYAELALLAKPELGLPGGAAAEALSTGLWTGLMAGVFLVLVTFPSGVITSRSIRRWVLLVLSAFTVVWLVIATAPGKLPAPFAHRENPLAFLDAKAYIVPAIPLIVGCLLSIVVAAIRAVRSFRRSRGLEREQYKWLAASASALVVLLPFAAAFNYSRIAGMLFTLALTALPVSVGIAVLRYRLYEIDRIISRTLTYGALTLILGVAYVGLVLGGQALFSSFAGGSNLAIAVSTLVVAALFLPVRSRVQGFVDRRFYRRRYDAQRTLEGFGARLREQVDLETLRSDLGIVVEDTMQPAHVSVWLRREPAR
jgi:hypothetical protein